MKLRFLMRDRDRHGKVRYYARRYRRRIRIRERLGTPAFAHAFARALDQLDRGSVGVVKRGPARGTLGWLADHYMDSAEFAALDIVSQRRRRSIIDDCLSEINKNRPMRECPLAMFTPAKVKTIRDAKGNMRGAANNRLKYLSAVFGWAIENGYAKTNPCRDVRRLRYVTSGFHAWSVQEVEQFEERHPIGTKPRLALALLLFLGVRRGDVVRLGPHMVKDGVLSFVPSKTKRTRTAQSHKPILPELARIIAKSPTGKATYLETAYGKPFTAAGFGNWFRAQCDLAGLPECSAHGLRKAGATIAAERGATVHQLMALFDWSTIQQAEVYTRSADRRRLAAEAAELLGR
jgi:integrase